MNRQSNSSLTYTWKAQIRQVAARNPRLARELWHNRQGYFERFVHFYRQLANLPRKLRRKFLKNLATSLAGVALLLALGQAFPARAAMITVDGVVCTLTEAIDSANNDNAAGNGCVDGSGSDVIDLQADVILSVALPQIKSEITLEGNGHILDGNHSFRVLNVQSTGNLTLNDALVTGGDANTSGGGILNVRGIVTVNNSTISGNSAYDYGGGILNNDGILTVNNSTISNNSCDYGFGGGIHNMLGGTVTVNNSTISNNIAFFNGGGLRNLGSVMEINNSTISGNSVMNIGGGIYNDSDTQDGILILNHSVISGNSAINGGAELFNSITVVANNFNVIGYGGDARSVGFIPGPNDLIPAGLLTSVLHTTLADNGGPTLTHALIPGSVAIDLAPNEDCTASPINGLDQRGYIRNVNGDGNPSGNECDAGAFEFDPGDLPSPTPTATQIFRATKTPVPTSTPITRTPPPTTSTRTPPPRVTQALTRTPTATLQTNVSLPASSTESSDSVGNWLVVSLFALANLFFFRNRKA